MGDEEKLVRLLCLKMMAADSIKTNKLKCYLNSLHPIHAEKPLEFFFSGNLPNIGSSHSCLGLLDMLDMHA